MSNNILSVTNFVTIQVAEAPVGLTDYKINNLLYLTKETPVNPVSPYAVYLSARDVATDFGVSSEAYAAAVALFSQTPNILSGDGSLIVHPMGANDTLQGAILKMENDIFFGGVIYGGYAPGDPEITDAAGTCQTDRKLLFCPQSATTVLNTGQLFADLTLASDTQTRELLYTIAAKDARIAAAAYAGRAMSTAFDGSNTTSNMHGKDLHTILPDPGITQTILNTCGTVGADVYANFGGVPKVFTSGANRFFDSVYNENWLVFALEVAGFNAIATASTKLPQTEAGVGILKAAYINVLQQAIRNGYIAPGTWNSPDRFGDPEDMISAIATTGYYIYSTPVSQQAQTDRSVRKAPLIQIAVKEAGAINSSNVIVNIEA